MWRRELPLFPGRAKPSHRRGGAHPLQPSLGEEAIVPLSAKYRATRVFPSVGRPQVWTRCEIVKGAGELNVTQYYGKMSLEASLKATEENITGFLKIVNPQFLKIILCFKDFVEQ